MALIDPRPGFSPPGETMGAQKARLGRPIERSECGHGPGSHCGLSDRPSSPVLRPLLYGNRLSLQLPTLLCSSQPLVYNFQKLSITANNEYFQETMEHRKQRILSITYKLSNTINNDTIVNFCFHVCQQLLLIENECNCYGLNYLLKIGILTIIKSGI